MPLFDVDPWHDLGAPLILAASVRALLRSGAAWAATTGTDWPTHTRERPGLSAFALEDGMMYQWLDRAPRGRDETRAEGDPPTSSDGTTSTTATDVSPSPAGEAATAALKTDGNRDVARLDSKIELIA